MKSLLILLFTFLLLCSPAFLIGQDGQGESESQIEKNSNFRFQGDTRRTFVSDKSAVIYGVRFGRLIGDKTELGVGIYSSNLFGILGNTVSKNYIDNRVTPSLSIPSSIGFHYFSIFGEYTLIKNDRLTFTANSQLGLGWVDIRFDMPLGNEESLRERKALVEHSIKADVKTFEWLRLMGGVGYRYLVAGEQTIKDAFNAPIYIIGFSIDFKLLYNQLFK